MATAARTAPAGPAHVAVVSFLAARAAPAGGFWIALAGGVALARVARLRGARLGFGAAVAAMLETVAIIGPARVGIPLTQAATAPLLGRLDARGWTPLPQVVVCAAIRLVHNAATTAFFIWVIAGGLDAYASTYDAVSRRFGIEIGTADAAALTLAGLLVWAVFASTVQVLVYRRGLRDWDRLADESHVFREIHGERTTRGYVGRFDPRAVALAAAVAFGLLLATTAWVLLAAVALWLALAWAAARPDRSPVPAGIVFAALLAGGAFLFGLGGGLGLDMAARRAARAALLVATATWLRGAAGAAGLREVARRVLGRLRRVPSAREATEVLDGISSEGRLAASAQALERELRGVPKRPLDVVDAVLRWVVAEAARTGPAAAPRALALRPRAADAALLIAAALPALAL